MEHKCHNYLKPIITSLCPQPSTAHAKARERSGHSGRDGGDT